MVTEIIGILETAAVALSGFLVKKYVFLEPDMETKKPELFCLQKSRSGDPEIFKPPMTLVSD